MVSYNPSPTEIESLDYSRFVSLIDERNRCSGGIRSVNEVIINSRLNNKSNVLEIGCNTGFTSINLAYLSGCKVVGVDINGESLELARQYAKRNGLEDQVNFQFGNAENLSFPDETFDLVWASNVTSFMKNGEVAISEYLRVLKFGGTFSSIPIYYRRNPPKELVSEVSKAIGNRIEIYTKNSWEKLFERTSKNLGMPIELYYVRDFEYEDVDDKIDNFIKLVLDKPNLRRMDNTQKEAINKKAKYFYNLFNKNLQYCGYSILLYQKRREQDEVELFLTSL
ncbi:MAG: class I SAM-dependent methyltransferase [Nanoarchaeota archaeon]